MVKTIINHHFEGLYNLFKVILGMVFYGFTYIMYVCIYIYIITHVLRVQKPAERRLAGPKRVRPTDYKFWKNLVRR